MRPAVWAIVNRARLSDPDAGEAEVWLRAWRAYPRMVASEGDRTDGHRWEGWTVRIAQRVAIDAARRDEVARRNFGERAMSILEDSAGGLLDVDDVVGPGRGDPAEQVERAAQIDLVFRVVAGLTPRHRRVMAGWLSGRTDQEVAAGLGETRAAVKALRWEVLQAARGALVAAGFSDN